MRHTDTIFCDHCGEPIDGDRPEGVISWLESTTSGERFAFAVTHRDCRWLWQPENSDGLPLNGEELPLGEFLDEKGGDRLLKHFSALQGGAGGIDYQSLLRVVELIAGRRVRQEIVVI